MKTVIEQVTAKFEIKEKFIQQSMSDCEGAVKNGFVRALEKNNEWNGHQSCFVHVLQTVIKHGVNFQQNLYIKQMVSKMVICFTRE